MPAAVGALWNRNEQELLVCGAAVRALHDIGSITGAAARHLGRLAAVAVGDPVVAAADRHDRPLVVRRGAAVRVLENIGTLGRRRAGHHHVLAAVARDQAVVAAADAAGFPLVVGVAAAVGPLED